MTFVRIYHIGSVITTREHLRAEFETGTQKSLGPGLGTAAYTPDNLQPSHKDEDWFVIDLADCYDAQGEIPFEAISVSNPAAPSNGRSVHIDPVKRDDMRRAIDMGPVHRANALAKLKGLGLTDEEIAAL